MYIIVLERSVISGMMTDKVPTLEELLEKAKALPDSKYPNWVFHVISRNIGLTSI